MNQTGWELLIISEGSRKGRQARQGKAGQERGHSYPPHHLFVGATILVAALRRG